MQTVSNIQGICFDLYNTLVYFPRYTKSYERLIEDISSHTLRDSEELYTLVQTRDFETLGDFVEYIEPGYKLDIHNFQRDVEQEINQVKEFEDTRDTLAFFQQRSIPLVLISNVATPYKQPLFSLELHSFFQTIIFSSEVGYKKPDKEIFEIAIENLQANPEKLVMVGDSLKSDIQGANAVGMQTIHIDRTGRQDNSIKRLQEICAIYDTKISG